MLSQCKVDLTITVLGTQVTVSFGYDMVQLFKQLRNSVTDLGKKCKRLDVHLHSCTGTEVHFLICKTLMSFGANSEN